MSVGGLLILLGVLWLLDAAEVLTVWRWGLVGPLLVICVGLWRIVAALGGAERDAVRGSVDRFVVLSDRRLHCDGPFEGGSIAARGRSSWPVWMGDAGGGCRTRAPGSRRALVSEFWSVS